MSDKSGVSDPDRNGENFDKSVTGGAAELRARWEKSINNKRERGLQTQVMLTLPDRDATFLGHKAPCDPIFCQAFQTAVT